MAKFPAYAINFNNVLAVEESASRIMVGGVDLGPACMFLTEMVGGHASVTCITGLIWDQWKLLQDNDPKLREQLDRLRPVKTMLPAHVSEHDDF